MIRRHTTAAVLLLAWTATAHAQDWPQFRGPDGQGHSLATPAPLEWSESRNVSWKTPVPGSGWSSPVVSNGKVWLTSAVKENARGGGAVSLRALSFDAETGRQLLDVEVFRIGSAAAINVKNGHASPTPVIDGDRVFVHFGAQGTAALSTTGQILWKTKFAYDSQHGSGGSPIVYKDMLIFNVDGPIDAFVVALDVATGKTRWKTSRRSPFDQAYSTPLAIVTATGDQIVSIGAHRVAAYDPNGGREIWRANYPGGFSNVPRPVFGHDMVYIATGFNDPTLIAVRVDGKGDVTKSHIAWRIERGAPLTPSPLLVGDLLYFVSDIGIATCVEARTGTPKWQQRIGGNYSASPILAAGRIYFLSEEGVATAIEPGPIFKRLAQNTLDGATLASIAASGKAFFIRTASHLYRIEE